MNLICSIFGHKKIIRDWYPSDPITSLDCLRCKKRLDSRKNPWYFNIKDIRKQKLEKLKKLQSI